MTSARRHAQLTTVFPRLHHSSVIDHLSLTAYSRFTLTEKRTVNHAESPSHFVFNLFTFIIDQVTRHTSDHRLLTGISPQLGAAATLEAGIS
jgi:hypothetical protein